MKLFPPLSDRLTDLSQGAHAHEVVGRHRQYEDLVDLLDAAHHDLANRADKFGPTKGSVALRILLLNEALPEEFDEG